MRKIDPIIGLVVLLIVFACDESSDPVDTNAPSIEVIEPAKGEMLNAGEFAHFNAQFIDDFELATYNIEIHENFEGHGHGGRIGAINDDPSLIKWSYNQSFLIPEGLTIYQAVLQDEIEIPTNILAGPYHFIVQAIDKAGNSTSFQDDSAVELEIYIASDSQPFINITNLEDDELEIRLGEVFMVKGDVTDPTTGEYAGMHSIKLVLGEDAYGDHDHDHGGRVAEDELIDELYEEEALVQFMVDDAIIIDKIFESINFTLSQEQLDDLVAEEIDHLLLTISVHDEQGNIAVSRTQVHIHMQ